jgi:DNA-binding response OmpR family regulator
MKKRGTVLIVEDEPIMAYGLKIRFEKWGFDQVEILDNCQAAKDCLQSYSPVLILIDVDSSNGDICLDTAELYQEQFTTSVLFLSALAVRLNPKKLKLITRYKRLTKPCRIHVLRKAVEQMLQITLPLEEGLLEKK